MNTIDTTSSAFHMTFDLNARKLMEPVRNALLESTESCSRDEILGQLLMNLLGSGGDCPHDGQLPTELKMHLIAIADHMGPDWAQALYHTAVFITKVA